MEQNLIITILLIALILISGIQVIQLYSIKTGITGNAINSDGQLDTRGWTENEKMNYEMHGTIPARLQGSNTPSSSSGMVGGC